MRSLSKSGYNGGTSNDAIQYESLSGFAPPSTLGPYRADDYWKLPEGEPVELIRGRFVVLPAPDTIHKTVAGLLTVFLFGNARKSVGRALAAPVDVLFDDQTVLQPNLLYVRERRGIIKKRVQGPPDLLIEILRHTILVAIG